MDAFTLVVAIIGGALVTWGMVSLIFFMIDDVWPFQPHSIAWLPGGWAEQRTVPVGKPIPHG